MSGAGGGSAVLGLWASCPGGDAGTRVVVPAPGDPDTFYVVERDGALEGRGRVVAVCMFRIDAEQLLERLRDATRET